MKWLLLFCISQTIAIRLSPSTSCVANTDCAPNYVCVYEQTCDSNGCTQSAEKVCKETSITQTDYAKSQEIEEYLSSLNQQGSQYRPQLVIRSAPQADSMIQFQKKGNEANDFKMGLQDATSDFVIQSQGQTYFQINGKSGEVVVQKNLRVDKALRIGMNGTVLVNGVSQYLMIHEETADSFDLSAWQVKNAPSGCAALVITRCGGIQLLGGYGILSSQILSTSISLAGYTYKYIKLEAIFHFIDGWAGQTAYLRLGKSGGYLWTDSFDFTQTKNSLNLCGSDIGEGKFTSLIEAVISPSEAIENDILELEFGTTLETDPFYASYAISAIRIYIR